MSERASELLRHELENWKLLDEYAAVHVMSALPEIIAVVETAEKIFGYIEPEHRSGPSVVKLYDSLDALAFKLSGEAG